MESPSLVLTPPHRERLADILYGQILEQVASGVLVEGAKLPTEKELSAMFKASRPVVREALSRLQSDGILQSRQGSGTYVKRKPAGHLMDVTSGASVSGILRCLDVRSGFEGQCARLAARERTTQDLDALKTAMDRLRTAFEAGAIQSSVDLAFHRAIARSTSNELAVATFDFLAPYIISGSSVTLEVTRMGAAERVRRVVDEHQRILDAIVDRDEQGAEIAMRYHLDQARKRLMDGTRAY